jgi:hypothetical protein
MHLYTVVKKLEWIHFYLMNNTVLEYKDNGIQLFICHQCPECHSH